MLGKALPFLLCGVLVGCSAPEQPTAFVDLTALSQFLSEASPAVPEVRTSLLKGTASIRGTPGVRLFGGLTQKELDESIALIRTNQQEAIQRIMAQRIKVLDAEIESALAASRARLTPEHERLLQDAIAQTRIPFDKLAPRAGKLTLELTNLIGFPDIGQSYRAVDAQWSKDRVVRIGEIRAELEKLNTDYLAERNGILEQARRRIARDDESLLNNASVARKEGEERIIADLQSLNDGKSDDSDDQRSPAGAYLDIPAAPSSLVHVNSGNGSLGPLPGHPPRVSPAWTAEQRAKIWAGSHGLRLVTNRKDGRDATQECIKWIQEQAAGH